MRRSLFFVFFGIALCFCAMTSAAQAQATRTWVSGLGDDANPCSRTAPCKTFAGAYSRTAAGGEIDVLDPGGYGTLSIGHALTIDGGGGVVASVLAANTTGFNINAGTNDVVTLRNIQFNGVSQVTGQAGITGIAFNSGLVLNVEHVVIQNFTQYGINFQPMVRSYLHIQDSTIENCGLDGMIVSTAASTGGVNRVQARRTSFFNSGQNGVHVLVNSRVELYDDVMGRNGLSGTGDGVLANGGNTGVEVDASLVSNNGMNGLHTQSGAIIRASDSSMYDNGGIGVFTDTGSIYSGLNNRVKGNAGGDGTFTAPIPLS